MERLNKNSFLKIFQSKKKPEISLNIGDSRKDHARDKKC